MGVGKNQLVFFLHDHFRSMIKMEKSHFQSLPLKYQNLACRVTRMQLLTLPAGHLFSHCDKKAMFKNFLTSLVVGNC